MTWLRILVTILLCCCALASAARGETGGSGICDEGLMGTLSGSEAYRWRGDRCEGLYVLQVSNPHLRIVSLTEFFEAFDPERPEDLTIEWDAPPGAAGQLRLRASDLRPDTFYRMDARPTLESGSYLWTCDLLAQLEISSRSLGMAGFTEEEPGGLRTYYPLRIRQASAAAHGVYDVQLVPDYRLSEVYVTLSRVDGEASTSAALCESVPLDYGFYLPDEVTAFSLANLGRKGYYELTIDADLDGGDTLTTSLRFYHESDGAGGQNGQTGGSKRCAQLN